MNEERLEPWTPVVVGNPIKWYEGWSYVGLYFVVFTVVVVLTIPWLVRLTNILVPAYERYAKWACGC